MTRPAALVIGLLALALALVACTRVIDLDPASDAELAPDGTPSPDAPPSPDAVPDPGGTDAAVHAP